MPYKWIIIIIIIIITSDFVSKVGEVTLLRGECLSFYNVTALFTSVPIDPALNIIKDLLEKDDTLSNRSVLSVQNIIELLGFCVHNTIIGREGQDFTRLIKESIFIRINNPTLNRNIGKFQLSHIWDKVLFSTPNIKVVIPKGNVQS